MKNLILMCGLFLSLMNTGFSQAQLPSPDAIQIACPDPAIIDLNIQWVNTNPPQNYHVYNMIGVIRNLGAANFDPALSGFTAFWYANSGGGYKLVKTEALPAPIGPGGVYSIVYKGRILPGGSVPSFVLRIAPTINVPPIQSDCDLSNNKKAFSL